MTFSIIVPVYNVEKYLSKCLDSMLNQSFQDFEIVVVNDGSPDNSQLIIDEYAKKFPEKVKAFIKENGGLSDARNFGIERAQGDYLLFVDSDDYISVELLQKLKEEIDLSNPDTLRFSAVTVYENGEQGERLCAPQLHSVTGETAISRLIDNKQYFEPSCFYAYRRRFWMENEFSFAKGRYHEDFGLIPEVIIKSQRFSAIDHTGYFYFQSSSSIMRTENEEKNNKRAFDGLHHFDHLRNVAETCIQDAAIRKKFNSYITNSVITRINFIFGTHKKEYLKALRERRVFDLLLDDTPSRRLKKMLIKIRYDLFGGDK